MRAWGAEEGRWGEEVRSRDLEAGYSPTLGN